MSEFESGNSEYKSLGVGFKAEFRKPEEQRPILEELKKEVSENE